MLADPADARARAAACWCKRFADRMIVAARDAGAGSWTTRPGDVEGTAVDVDVRAPAAGHAVSEPVLTGGEGFTDAMTFAFADREAGFFGLARAGVADGQGSALGVLFAGREPVSLVAEGGHPVDGRGLGRAGAARG